MKLPQSGATRHDVIHALEFAAAHSAQREAEWTRMRLPPSKLTVADVADLVTESDSHMHARHSESARESEVTQKAIESDLESEKESEALETEKSSFKDRALEVDCDHADMKVSTSDLGGDDDVIDDLSEIHDAIDSEMFIPSESLDVSQGLDANFPLGRRVSAPIGSLVTRRVRPSRTVRSVLVKSIRIWILLYITLYT